MRREAGPRDLPGIKMDSQLPPTRTILMDDAPGEWRLALLENDRAVRIRCVTKSSLGLVPQFGEIWCGQVMRLAPDRSGRFVELGGSVQGYVRLSNPQAFLAKAPEGMRLLFRVLSEASNPDAGSQPDRAGDPTRHGAYASRKLPRLGLVTDLDVAIPASPQCVQRIADPAVSFKALYPDAKNDERLSASDIRARIDAAHDLAIAPIWSVPGGGRMSVEPCAAMVAIDIDSADRTSAHGVSAQHATNLAAMPEIIRACRLKELAGLIAVDPAGNSRPAQSRELRAALEAAIARDVCAWNIAPTYPLGVMMLSRERRWRSNIHTGNSLERQALDSFRALDSALLVDRSSFLDLVLEPSLYDWLAHAGKELRARAGDDLASRFGARFTLSTAEPIATKLSCPRRAAFFVRNRAQI